MREAWLRYWLLRFSVVFANAHVAMRKRRLEKIRGGGAPRQVDAELFGVGDPSIGPSPENHRHGL